MKPFFINIVPGESTTIAIVATLLGVFGLIALIRNNRMTLGRRLMSTYTIPVPTGNISQINKADNNPVYPQLFDNEHPPSRRLGVQPTGSIMSLSSQVPASYAGPVVIEGSKYLWESRWSHLPSFEQGREGEERVVNTLVNTLSSGWFIFRNFVLPTENEDIDVVLVGPAGVFAMEVKAFSGEVKFERGRCYRKTARGRLYMQKRGPVGQVRHSAVKLNSFLKENGISGRNHVMPLVVLSGESPMELASTHTDVCTISNLRSRFSDISATGRTSLTQAEVQELARILQMASSEQTRANTSRVH